MKENEKLKAQLREMTRKEKRVRENRQESPEKKLDRIIRVKDNKYQQKKPWIQEEEAWKQYITKELNNRLRRPEQRSARDLARRATGEYGDG